MKTKYFSRNINYPRKSTVSAKIRVPLLTGFRNKRMKYFQESSIIRENPLNPRAMLLILRHPLRQKKSTLKFSLSSL